MKKGIIGKKLGMTQIFDEKGNVIPVTLIEAGPCVVAQKKTVANDGYDAVQLAYEDVKAKNVNKAQLGHFKKAGISPKRHLKEFRLDDCSALEAGSVVTVDTFAAGEKVDITGITKGHGYTGAIKRWNLHKLRMTHGVGPVHRQSGSMGVIDPARIFKNKKMAGQWGNEQVTILNLVAVKIDAEKNLIAVKGAVPGAKGGIVFIRDSVKA
ncbi:MAG: 50S ribosomal protein L3 [Ruminococcaceae bacterium]|nr:50S ribosomal protein L3 [Oscillospiraceae bacterium]